MRQRRRRWRRRRRKDEEERGRRVAGGGVRGLLGWSVPTYRPSRILPPFLFLPRSLPPSLSSSPAFLSAPRPRAWPATDLRARTREKTTQSKGGGSESDVKERRDAEAVCARARVHVWEGRERRRETAERAQKLTLPTHTRNGRARVERSCTFTRRDTHTHTLTGTS